MKRREHAHLCANEAGLAGLQATHNAIHNGLIAEGHQRVGVVEVRRYHCPRRTLVLVLSKSHVERLNRGHAGRKE